MKIKYTLDNLMENYFITIMKNVKPTNSYYSEKFSSKVVIYSGDSILFSYIIMTEQILMNNLIKQFKTVFGISNQKAAFFIKRMIKKHFDLKIINVL